MRSKILKTAAIVAGVFVAAAIGFIVWTLDAYSAEPVAYASTIADSRVRIERRGGFITITPAGPTPHAGLLFYPGLRVRPHAYVAKLSDIARKAHIQVVIGNPPFNVAVFSISQAEAMRSQGSSGIRWYVGGHSLGGAMACLYAKKHPDKVAGVVLFGTYCGSDVSDTKLRVLIVAAGNDGVFPPRSILEHKDELPLAATTVLIPGMNHAQFGNYGAQNGDIQASINDAEASRRLAAAMTSFFSPAWNIH